MATRTADEQYQWPRRASGSFSSTLTTPSYVAAFRPCTRLNDILKTAICFENRPRDALESFARRINDEPFSR
jgi:hypothetical protein